MGSLTVVGSVRLVDVNKIYGGKKPQAKSWYEFWKPGSVPSKVHVVKGSNMDIRDGEFMVFVGPSGCGKSTTLRMIAGLEEVTSGDIFIGDKRVNDASPKDRDIAMVFQNYALYPHFTVFENMAFGLRLRKYSAEDITARVNHAAELLGITNLLERKPKELSGGQRQRVAMGRAIVRKPQVFLMDEPLSNLDAKLRVQMRAELQKLHTALGVTTIYVTHDQTEAMTLGDRIALMNEGYIQQIDTPLNLYEHPVNKYVAGFIGSPSMNFITAEIVAKNGGYVVECPGFSVELGSEAAAKVKEYAGKKVTLGVRPEDIYDAAYARDDAPMASFTAKVEVFEPMGAEVYLHIVVSGCPMIARVDAHTAYRVGDEAKLSIDKRKLHLFDIESEKAISLAD